MSGIAAIQARAQLRPGSTPRMSRDQITQVIAAITDLAAMINNADPRDKAKIYTGLGIRLTYHPGQQAVFAEAQPATAPVCALSMCRRGDSTTHSLHPCAGQGFMCGR